MSYVDLVDETICALITTPGLSGISVIRVSGPRALEITRQFCSFLPAELDSHKVYFGKFKSLSNELIDECLVTYFSEGRSFTDDETCEISVHGGHACASRVLTELLSQGCRAAEKGEFTFRAFYNGKIDLVQAEAVHSLIKSRSDHARGQAVLQLSGRLSHKISLIEENLIRTLAQIEASIDFSTEDIEPYSVSQISDLLKETQGIVQNLTRSFQRGRVLEEGLRIALVGAPNVGKSSLYNALLGQDKAIVTSVAGTTRDILESTMNDFGLPLWLVDTAGLRETNDEIEKIGIQKTQKQLVESDLVFYLLEANKSSSWDLGPIKTLLDNTVFVVTKIDEIEFNVNTQNEYIDKLKSMMDSHDSPATFFISSKTLQGIQELKEYMESKSLVDIHHDEGLITQHRHFDHLVKCENGIKKSIQMLTEAESFDLVALELQASLKEVFTLLGKEYDDQVLDRVFQQFCIGK